MNLSSSEFKSNDFTEMYCGNEAGSYLRLIDSCITHLNRLKDNISRTCKEMNRVKKNRSSSEHSTSTTLVAGPWMQRRDRHRGGSRRATRDALRKFLTRTNAHPLHSFL